MRPSFYLENVIGGGYQQVERPYKRKNPTKCNKQDVGTFQWSTDYTDTNYNIYNKERRYKNKKESTVFT